MGPPFLGHEARRRFSRSRAPLARVTPGGGVVVSRSSRDGSLTDRPSASPPVPRSYCPGCEPNADPSREILDVCWCDTHVPARDGLDDAVVASHGYLAGGDEAGGESNRRWCELLHRGVRG